MTQTGEATAEVCAVDEATFGANRAIEWYTHGVVYQIFPDRYKRDADWQGRTAAGLQRLKHGPKRTLVNDWSLPPHYAKNEQGNVVHWDFYGGSLKGITQDINRIAAAGFTIIYLNPIFCAASNHRYDTADYYHVDPILGTDADFEELCRAAAHAGISIVLDGVFAHTGRDSRYFNRFGNYPELGAWQSQQGVGEDSPSVYRDWYLFHADESYACWDGVEDLPSLNLSNPDVLEFFCGTDGVLRHWIRAGARGWRLDAADKLTDESIALMKQAVIAERTDAVLVGEVWSDAMQPNEQGETRQYFGDCGLDGVTNYPMCCLLREFLCGQVTAFHFAKVLNSLYERYSPSVFSRCLNMLGSHDMPRILSALGGAPVAKEALPEDEAGRYRLTDNQRVLAITRLRLAVFLQFCLPGVPCVYAGDEAGVEGLDDPYNRATYPWGNEDKECMHIYEQAIRLRKSLPVLISGDFRAFAEADDVFCFSRALPDCTVVVIANRNMSQAVEVELPFVSGELAACKYPFSACDVQQDEQRQVFVCTIPACSGALVCIRCTDDNR